MLVPYQRRKAGACLNILSGPQQADSAGTAVKTTGGLPVQRKKWMRVSPPLKICLSLPTGQKDLSS